MLVQAECLIRAWDSNEAVMYEPGMGPLPGGLYEIDTDNVALTSLIAVGGKWVFQYEGHTGGPGKTRPAVAVQPAVEAKPVDRRKIKKGPMSAEQKAKLKEAMAAARAAKRARLEAA